MNFDLSREDELIRTCAREFAKKEIEPRAKENDLTGKFPAETLKKMARLGFMGVTIPAEFGGAGAGAVAYVLVMSEIAKACASTSVGMGVTNLSAEAINLFGNEEQKRRFLPRLMSGEILGAFALSEPSSGSDAAALRTTAVKDGRSFILNGSKQFITSGAYAGVIVVMARTSKEKGAGGISALLVEKGMEELRVTKEEDKMGLRASNTVSLSFEDLKVPKENLLGQEGDGFKVAMRALDGGRIGISAQAYGIGMAALEASKKYALEREQFGKKIADFQAISFMLADMATELEAARLLALKAAHLRDKGMPHTKEAASAKLFASEAANRVCQKAIQIHGGYGYTGEFPVERYFRDCRVTTIYEGTSEVQRLVIAREVLRSAKSGL